MKRNFARAKKRRDWNTETLGRVPSIYVWLCLRNKALIRKLHVTFFSSLGPRNKLSQFGGEKSTIVIIFSLEPIATRNASSVMHLSGTRSRDERECTRSSTGIRRLDVSGSNDIIPTQESSTVSVVVIHPVDRSSLLAMPQRRPA